MLALLDRRRAQRLVASVVPLWIVNQVAVRAAPSVIKELAARPEVREVRPDFTIQAPAPLTASGAAATAPAAPEPNVALVNAPALWDLGFRGQGIVVANMDTGVDATHPDLAGRWRGGTNSWYDPNGEHPTTPTDVNGHGTWTMGAMVGGDAGGTSIGVAPDARWIAVKIFNDRGTTTSTMIHRGFQWLLDPDGNPATADAPNVVNDSWTMSVGGCNLDFQLDLRNLRAAGILPVFSAGNYGPSPGTVLEPGQQPRGVRRRRHRRRRRPGLLEQPRPVGLRPGRGPQAGRPRGERAHQRPVRLLPRRLRHLDRGPARRRGAGPAARRLPRAVGRPAGGRPGGRRRRPRRQRPRQRLRQRTPGRPRRLPAAGQHAGLHPGGVAVLGDRRPGWDRHLQRLGRRRQRLRRRRRPLAGRAVGIAGELELRPAGRPGRLRDGTAHRDHRGDDRAGQLPADDHREQRLDHPFGNGHAGGAGAAGLHPRGRSRLPERHRRRPAPSTRVGGRRRPTGSRATSRCR